MTILELTKTNTTFYSFSCYEPRNYIELFSDN